MKKGVKIITLRAIGLILGIAGIILAVPLFKIGVNVFLSIAVAIGGIVIGNILLGCAQTIAHRKDVKNVGKN